jgi:hypothetical protein
MPAEYGLSCALVLQGDFAAAIEVGRDAMADSPNYVPALAGNRPLSGN